MILLPKLRWELFVSIITAASVGIIVLDYSYDFAPNEKLAVYIFDSIVVALLIIDFRRRMKESNEGYRYLLTHWYEIPAMLPIFVFDSFDQYMTIGAFLRTMRLIRLFRLIQLLSRTARIFADTKYVYMIILSGGAIILGGLAIYLVESDNKEANIRSIGDGIWWAITTVTTVGYGDKYPVTIGGRIIASMVMVIGIAVLGFFISTLGASLVESRIRKRSTSPISDSKNAIKNKIERLENLHEEELPILLSEITQLYASSKSLREMPHCSNCGNTCPDSSLFCNLCGTSLTR